MEFSVSRSHTRNFMNQSYEHFSMFRSSVKNAFLEKFCFSRIQYHLFQLGTGIRQTSYFSATVRFVCVIRDDEKNVKHQMNLAKIPWTQCYLLISNRQCVRHFQVFIIEDGFLLVQSQTHLLIELNYEKLSLLLSMFTSKYQISIHQYQRFPNEHI